MKNITIDCAGIPDKPAFHRAVSQALDFPVWYGGNADALHDCLTDICTDTCLRFLNWDQLSRILGNASAPLRAAMTHAALENPHIQIEFE